jgi:hypothetical protein
MPCEAAVGCTGENFPVRKAFSFLMNGLLAEEALPWKPDDSRSHGDKQPMHLTAEECLAEAEQLEKHAAETADPDAAVRLRARAHGFRVAALFKTPKGQGTEG